MRFGKFKLRRRKNFIRALSGFSGRIKSDVFEIGFCRNECGFPRFAVVVPKKIVKKAVKRNRIKRIVREAMYQLLRENKIPPFDIVIRVKKDVSSRKSHQIKAIFEEKILSNVKP